MPKQHLTHYFFLMSKQQDPRGSGSGRVSGKEMADALADVLHDQAEKSDRRQGPGGGGGRKKAAPATLILLVVFSSLSAYIWFGSPTWLPSGPAPTPPALVEAGIRLEIFQEALRVEGFLEAEGRLPEDLAEAGDPYAEVEYQQVDPMTYRLALAGPEGIVEYVSRDSLELFLGDAEMVIRTGGR